MNYPSTQHNHYQTNLTSPTNTNIMQNEHGQGVSHASDDSKVPGKVQEKAPKDLEESLPDSVCYFE